MGRKSTALSVQWLALTVEGIICIKAWQSDEWPLYLPAIFALVVIVIVAGVISISIQDETKE